MDSSPRCPSCGYRALRRRKRTRDFVCRRCCETFPVAIVGETERSAVVYQDLALAFAELNAARSRIHAAVRAVWEQHKPIGGLVLALSLATLAIVFGITQQSVRWFFAIGFGLVAAIMVFALLTMRGLGAWKKDHPLLAAYFHALFISKSSKSSKSSDPASLIPPLLEAIVRSYLPPIEGQRLLSDLEHTEARVNRLAQRTENESSST